MKITLQFECEECGKITEAELDLEGRENERFGATCCPVGAKGKRGVRGVPMLNMADDSWFSEHDTTSEHGGV